jgi:sigma54-dependent transcription regulator
MEKQPEERFQEALLRPDSTLKRVASGFLEDAGAAAERAKNLKDAAGISQLFAEEETNRLRGLYEDSKLQALAALKFVDDKKFEKGTRQKFEELDKVFSEKKDG